MRSVRHHSALGWWTLSFAAPHPLLSGHVRTYCGWEEQTVAPLWRIEAPGPDVPLIILFEEPVLARDRPDRPPVAVGSFVAGLSDRHTLVGSAGRMAGIQANFTPLGARLLLGCPMRDFANRMVALEDVWGAEAASLAAELAGMQRWTDRFDRLDRFILDKLTRASLPHPALIHALDVLLAHHGQVQVGELARRAGWSRRHLAARMEHEFGLAPKTLARVLRLDRAVGELRAGGRVRLAEVAVECGYYDQAHFTRDFRDFTGMTPTEFLRGRLPDGGGVAAR